MQEAESQSEEQRPHAGGVEDTCRGGRILTGQAHYLAVDSPKLRYLAKIFLDEGAFSSTHPRRFIVFAQWPFVLWLVEMFIDALSLPYVVVRA